MHIRKRGKVCEDGLFSTNANREISSIIWNETDLPQTVSFSSSSSINYYYAADGTKLRESKTASGTTTTTDYTGNLILENGTRSRLVFDGGYVSMTDSGYHFFITDHPGSVVSWLAVVDDGKIIGSISVERMAAENRSDGSIGL